MELDGVNMGGIANRNVTEEMRNAVISEVKTIMKEVVSKWLPKLESRQYPTIQTKLGGSTACYYLLTEDNIPHVIKMRYDSWNKMCLYQKRITVIHEFIHSLGVSHNNNMSFLSAYDQLSDIIYLKVYGEDQYLREFRTKMNEILMDIDNSIPKLNKRKIKYFKGSII